MLSKNDIQILNLLKQADCISPLKSYTIRRIQDEIQLKSTRVHYTLRALSMAGYVNEGCRQGNAKSYYITQKGKEAIREVLI
jgi:DNA-binding MarR family transcriptional regulator